MFDKIRNHIKTRTQEKENFKRQLEESNMAYEKRCEETKNMVKGRQTECNQNMKCPLCQGNQFFKNVRISYYNYHGNDRETFLSVHKEEGMSASDYSESGNIPLNTYVCKKCGNIILKMNFGNLNDHCFRGLGGINTFDEPIDWNV